MSTEENKAIVRRALEDVFNAARLDAVDELYGDGFVNHVPSSMGAEIRGTDGVKRNVAVWRAAFPDLCFDLEDELAERDLVVSRWRARGTHLGSLLGRPPSGRLVTVSAVEISRLRDARIVEQWLQWDTLALMRQLG